MRKVARNFYREEFACKCGCLFSAVDTELLDILVTIREMFGKKVMITSGCRCNEYNTEIGGHPNSYHTRGMAVDFVVEGVSPDVVQRLVEQTFPNQYGLGKANTFTHIDVRDRKSRWTY